MRTLTVLLIFATFLAPLASGQADGDALRLGADDLDSNLACALEEARHGQFEAARDRLARILGSRSGAPDRLVREHRRLEAVVAFRDAFLDEVRKGKKSLRLAGDVKGRVQKIEGGDLFLKTSREVLRLPKSSIDPASLYREARKRKKIVGDSLWLGAYLRQLGGQPRIKRLLSGDDDLTRGLVEDEASITALAATGRVAWLLDHLARVPEDQAGAALTALEELTGSHASHALVSARLDALRGLAERIFIARFDPKDQDCLGITGKLEHIDGDRVRVTYEFDEAAESSDFDRIEFLDRIRGENPIAPEKLETLSGLRPQTGMIVGRGAICYRHPLWIKGDFAIRYIASYQAGDDDDAIRDLLVGGLCGTGPKRYVLCRNLGDLESSDAAGFHRECVKDRFVRLQTPYEIELKSIGGIKLECRVGGELRSTIGIDAKLRGRPFFWVQSRREIHIDRFEFEGSLDVERMDETRKKWVSGKVASLGL